MVVRSTRDWAGQIVSMKSGLEGRNNGKHACCPPQGKSSVSMKSGLEGRNNDENGRIVKPRKRVSMKSGLEGRNNQVVPQRLELRPYTSQ